AGPGESEHHRARDGLLLWSEAAINVFGQARDGAADAAGRDVRVEPDLASLALVPELEQRGREQRERSGLVQDLGNQGLGQRRFYMDAHAEGGLLDRASVLVRRHRRDEQVVRREERRER